MYDIIIVEPHEDDAILSASRLLTNNDIKRAVITCSVRTKETKRLCESLGVDSFYIEKPDYDWNERLDDKAFTNWGDFGAYYRDHYRYNSEEIIGIFKKYIMENVGSTFYIPLGVKHPYHVLITQCFIIASALVFSEIFTLSKTCFYWDFPYCNRKRWAGYIQYMTSWCEPVVDVEPSPDRARLFKTFYPDQQGLLRFENDNWKQERFATLKNSKPEA